MIDLEIPKDPKMGNYALPLFNLAKILKAESDGNKQEIDGNSASDCFFPSGNSLIWNSVQSEDSTTRASGSNRWQK